MKYFSNSPSLSTIALLFCCIYLFWLLDRSQAQPTTDPSEVKALKSILQQWNKTARSLWDKIEEPCSGDVEDWDDNPGIKCDCAHDNGTTCHITHLRVNALDARGVIPEELGKLTYLTYLNVDKNYLTGPLPAFIGNLSALKFLSVGTNALSGPIPKELGQLRNLQVLAFGSNNFNGSLPPQLGNLVNLKEIYMDSSGVGGEIPLTFANLVNMQKMWISDNPLTGKIPDYIGNWTNLTSLRIQGNDFEGPIPSSFSSLTSLADLRISDLFNVSSSLDFIKNMKDLSTLVLRNNLISGNIPSDIGKYANLLWIDFSFNNLTGQIPSSLFKLSSLSYLFLGNNRLSGTLPSEIGSALLNVDMSYNELSGSFPSWVTQQNLTLNLVANNFLNDNLNNSVLDSGLNCLQRNFPCNRNSPRYSSFAINCGGSEKTSSSGINFESENLALGPTSYYVTNTRRWAVSNVGLFGDNFAATYIENTLSLITSTLDTELFLTARISPGSLRYYGLGLQNGIYNVNLQFAEIRYADESSHTWQSLGRRVFDIYLQGNLQLKDFDIRKEAGGVSFKAVKKNFKVQVSTNFLEIHLFWAGKGTCCIPVQGYYGPSISSISVTPDFIATVSNLPPTTSPKKKTTLIVGIAVVVGVVSFISIFAVYNLRKRKKAGNNDEEGIGARPNTFSYAELRIATEDFNPANKLGEGGFGPVYKGMLPDGRAVGVKKLSVTSNQGKSQFVTEIATISAVQHRNLVKLYGCCIKGDDRLLVYEYLENKSLDQALFGKSGLHLDWPTRYDICLGTARGLAYLHEESRPRIVHRDVKASNILLDTDLSPKISDFGLAKLYDDKKTHISTRIAGTIGYLAPEYAMRGHLTEKADVFGFGVVALEIVSGRQNSDLSLDQEKIYLLEWAWNLHENKQELELVDPTLTNFDKEEAIRMIGVALLCTQASPMLRPAMSRVVAMLTGDIEVSIVTSRPSYLTDLQYNDDTSTIVSDGTSGSFMSKATTSELDTANQSPIVVAKPLLHEIIEAYP